MSEKAFTDLREMLCNEVQEISRHNELSQNMLDNAEKLTTAIKNIDKIMMYSEGSDGSYHDGSYRDYDSGYSGRRYRDSNGRYASHRDGRSWGDAKETMIQQLTDMLGNASGTREKEIIRRARDELKEM